MQFPMGIEDKICEFAIAISGINYPMLKPDFFICKNRGLLRCEKPKEYCFCEYRKNQYCGDNYKK
jgi:hypothetical protein